MKDYKLIKILKQLSEKDLDNLKLFIQSPYFKISSDKALFFNELIKNIHTKDTELIAIWNSSLSQKYTHERLRKRLHDCLLITEKFLAIEEFQKSDVENSKMLIKSTKKKGINTVMSKGINSLNNALNQQSELTFEYYSNRFHYYNFLIGLETDYARKIENKKKRDSSDFLLKADKILNEIFLSEKLRLTYLLNHYNSVFNKNNNLTFVNEVNNLAIQTARKGSKPFFYLELMKLSNAENKLEKIVNLHSYISRKKELFSNSEFRTILIGFINEVILLLNRGHTEVRSTLFNLYKIGLENRIFISNNRIEADYFRNIIVNACKLKEFPWALQFIENYQNLLDINFRQNAVAFNKAIVFWNLKKYDKVIEITRDVLYEDLTYNLNTKILLLTSYYQLEEYEALDSLIKSFNVFLRRKTNISEARKSSFKNFNSTLQDIVRVKERRDKVKLKNVRKKLESKMIAPNKDWLMEKVEELEEELGGEEGVRIYFINL